MPRPASEMLTDREAQIMDILWELREATAEQVRQRLVDEPHDSTVRTLLRVLKAKRYVRIRGRQPAVYVPIVAKKDAQHTAAGRLIDRFFGGSANEPRFATSGRRAAFARRDRKAQEQVSLTTLQGRPIMTFLERLHDISCASAAGAGGELLLKATAVLAVALVLDFLLHRRMLLACSATWNGALVLLALLPIACLALPAKRVASTASVVANVAASTELSPVVAPTTSLPENRRSGILPLEKSGGTALLQPKSRRYDRGSG